MGIELLTPGGGVGGELVPCPLEIGKAEEGGATPAVDRDRQRSLQRAELLLEPRDLVAQRASRAGLVDQWRGDEGYGRKVTVMSQPPIGAFGLKPQKTCVPSMPIRWTPTVLKTIDFAVAVPTPTGPPDAV